MTGSPIRRSQHNADTQSMLSMNSVQSMDRDRLREKAKRFQMKENLRLMLCTRIQKQFRKPPRTAEMLAKEIMKLMKSGNVSVSLTDEELEAAVNRIVHVHDLQHEHQPPTAASGGEEISPAAARHLQLDQMRSASASASVPAKAGGGSGRSNPKGSGRDKSKPNSRKNSKHNKITNNDASIDEDSASVYVTETQSQQMSTGFHLPPKVSPKKDKSSSIWEEIAHYRVMEELQDKRQQKDQKMLGREKFSSTLNAQVEEKHAASCKERERNQQFYEENLRRIAHENELEEQKEQERLLHAKYLKQVQQQQRELKAQQKAKELENKRLQEQKLIDGIKKQNELEQQREKAKKQAEKDRITQVLHENELLLQEKKLVKQQEREYEMKLAADYIQMEEAKDAARKKQLEDLHANIKARMKVFDDTAKAEMEQKSKEEETRLLRYQQQYAQRQEQEEKNRKQQVEIKNRQQLVFLRQQMEEKRARESQFKQEHNKQAELWKQERAQAEARDRKLEQERKAKSLSQQEVLMQQMREKEMRQLLADQTPEEVQLNSKILEKIHQRQDQVHNTVVAETHDRSKELQQQEHVQSTLHQQRSSANAKRRL